jgi:hypothetical protein
MLPFRNLEVSGMRYTRGMYGHPRCHETAPNGTPTSSATASRIQAATSQPCDSGSRFPKRYAPPSVHCGRTGQDGGAYRAPPVWLIGPFLDVGILEAG